MLLCSNNIKHVLPLSFFCKESLIPGSFVTKTVILRDILILSISRYHLKPQWLYTMQWEMALTIFFWKWWLPSFDHITSSHELTVTAFWYVCLQKDLLNIPFHYQSLLLARQWDGPLWIIKICCDLKKILMIITPTIGFPGSGGGVKYKFSAGFRKLYSKFSIVIVKIDWVSTYQQKTSIWSSSGKVWSLYDAPLHHYTLRSFFFFS